MNAFPAAAALLLVFFPLSGGAAPVPLLDKDPAGYLRYVQTSPDPEAVVARREIAAGPAALARERAAAQKEGLAVFPVQLNRPLPPDDQNAAPLYVKVAALRRGRVRLPNYAETLSARYAYTPAQLERIQKIYDDNPDVFALLRQATDRPQCVFARDWTNGAPGSLFTEFTGLRESAREITTESVLLAEKGRCAEAVQNQTRGYRLAEHAASDPILISSLVAKAIEQITTSGMRDVLALAGPNADVAAQVTRAVSERGAHLSLRHSLSGEIALLEADFALLRHGDAHDFEVLFDSSVPISSLPRARFTPGERRAYLNLLDAAEADLISRMRRVVAAADTSAAAAAFAQSEEDIMAQTSDPVRMISEKLYPFRYAMLNVLPSKGAASRAVVQAAAAALIARAKIGAYPDALVGTPPTRSRAGPWATGARVRTASWSTVSGWTAHSAAASRVARRRVPSCSATPSAPSPCRPATSDRTLFAPPSVHDSDSHLREEIVPMPRTQHFWPLAALTGLLLAPTVRAQTVPPDRGRDPLGYLHYLEASPDPQAVAVRRQIAGGPAALARARDAAAKAGIPLDAAALQKPLPPDGENAATAYAALAQLLRDKPLRLPLYAQPLGTGYAYTPAQLAAVQKIYDSRRDVWDLVHQAADRPRCVFARDWKQGPAVLFPEYQWLREASRLLNTETYLLAAQGRYAEAVQNQTRGFRLAEHAASDPVLISYLVGEACGTIALQGMQNVLTLAGPDADVSALVAKAVTDNRPRLSLRYALGGEAALHETGYHGVHDGLPQANLAALTQVLAEGAPPADSGRPATPVQDTGAPATPADRLFVMEMMDEAEAKTLDGLRQMIGASDLPPRQRQAVFVRYAAAPPGSPLVPAIIGDILPVFAKIGGNDTWRQAREAVLLAAAAVLAARAKTGAYPDALPLPSPDPYTDGPLGYRREGADGFVVYSAGPDGTFGGGKPGDKTPGAILYRYPVLRVPVPPVMLQP